MHNWGHSSAPSPHTHGARNPWVQHQIPHLLQVLVPTVNPTNNAFCELTLAIGGCIVVHGTIGITSKSLLPGPETTFGCHLGPPKHTLWTFFTTFHPQLGLVLWNASSLWVITALQALPSCPTGGTGKHHPHTPTAPGITGFSTRFHTCSMCSSPRSTPPTILSVS